MSPSPDPTNPDLLKGLRNYLASQGIVRAPRDATSTAPPLWLAPRLGTPAPGETMGESTVEMGPTLVASASKAPGIVPRPYEGFLRNDAVEFIVRSTTASAAYKFENDVRIAINDKRGWMMDIVPVAESLIFRDLQPLGADNTGFIFSFEYIFNITGPFAPVGP